MLVKYFVKPSYLDNWGGTVCGSNSINPTNSAPEISGLADISVAENLVDASDNVSASFVSYPLCCSRAELFIYIIKPGPIT